MHIAMLGPMHTSDLVHLFGEQASLGYPGAPFLGTLAAALLELGHRLTLITTDKDAGLVEPTRIRRGLAELVVCPARRYASRPNGWKPGKAFDFFGAERRYVHDAVLACGADVVHAHWAYEFALAAIDTGRPALITVHDSPADVLRADKTIYNALRFLMARRSLRSGTRLAVVSPFIQERLAQSFGVSTSSILPNPLPLDAIEDIRANAVRAAAPTFLFVSNYWSKLKNPDIALKAFARLHATFTDARLLCIGRDFGVDGPAHRWATAQGLAAGVEFLGSQTHRKAMELIGSGTALLHTSQVESFGMAVAEAMGLGTPVIVDRNAGALPWLVDHGRAGYMADTASVESLVEVMRHVAADGDAVRAIASQGVRRATALCSPGLVAAQTESIYRTLVGT